MLRLPMCRDRVAVVEAKSISLDTFYAREITTGKTDPSLSSAKAEKNAKIRTLYGCLIGSAIELTVSRLGNPGSGPGRSSADAGF